MRVRRCSTEKALPGDLVTAIIDESIKGSRLQRYRDGIVIAARGQSRSWMGAADWMDIGLVGEACECVGHLLSPNKNAF